MDLKLWHSSLNDVKHLYHYMNYRYWGYRYYVDYTETEWYILSAPRCQNLPGLKVRGMEQIFKREKYLPDRWRT
jgi:hypothetical protein